MKFFFFFGLFILITPYYFPFALVYKVQNGLNINSPFHQRISIDPFDVQADANESLVFHNKTSDFDSLIIPLKRAGKLLMIEAKIDGQIGNLIFDTGATGLVLNGTYFRYYNRFETANPNSITGAVGKVYKTTVDSIDINGILYHNKMADIAELGHIENRRGVKVLGLFGFELIRKFEIIIDIRNNELTLIQIDKDGERTNKSTRPFKADFTQTIKEKNNILFVVGEIGTKQLRFCFDTGAEINAISNSLQKVVLNTVSINRRSKLVGANSETTDVLYGVMNDFTFGNKKYDNMQTVITNLSSLEDAYGVQFSGVLGYEFLEKGVICINLRKGELGIRFAKADEI